MFDSVPPSLFFALIGLFMIVSFLVFFRLPSGVFRQKLTSLMKPIGAFGVLLGVALPWNVGVGLVAAAIMAIILFILCVYAVIVIEAPFGLLRRAWIRREVVRDWFVYISIISGVVGIVSTILSIVLTFWNMSIGVEIPLAFDTISVSAALLEAMIPVTSYRKIYSLVYLHLIESNADYGQVIPIVKERDFAAVLKDTSYTEFEIRDALEELFAQGAVKKVFSKDGLVFEFTEDCLELLKVSLDETRVKIRIAVDKYEEKLDELLDFINKAPVKDYFKIVKRIDAFEKELITFIEENSRFEEIILLKMRLDTLLELKKTMYGEEIG